MCWKTVGQAAALVLAIPMTVAGRDFIRDEHRPALIVRMYNSYGVPSEDLWAAQVHVHAIFGDAGIDVLWMDCWPKDDAEAAGAPTECLQALGTNEVALRLLGTIVAPDKPFVSMGFALVKLQKRPPYLATVFVDLVALVARGANIDFRALLGRAIAHEIGHLLLNTNGHADQGLMRAVWSRAELGQNDPADWVFRQDEAATLREAAANRGGPTMDPGPSTMD